MLARLLLRLQQADTGFQFPLMQLVKAGFHTNPLVLDIVEIIECRALQDLKWRARVKLENGVYLIGQMTASLSGV